MPDSTTPNRDARMAAAQPADPKRKGTFIVKGKSVHHRNIAPVLDDKGNIKTPASTETKVPGESFTCEGDEAQFCRNDPEKFQEVGTPATPTPAEPDTGGDKPKSKTDPKVVDTRK